MQQLDQTTIPLRWLAMRGIAAILVAVAINTTILSFVERFALVPPFGALTYPPVTFLTILGTIAATSVYGAITRVWPYPDELFLKVAIIVLGASFLPTLGLLQADPEANVGAVLVLLVFHVTTAAVCIWMLTDRYSPLTP